MTPHLMTCEDSSKQDSDPGEREKPNEARENDPSEAESNRATREEREPQYATQPQTPSATQWQLPKSLPDIVKWLTMLVLAAVILIYAVTHPREIARWWSELLLLISRLLGGTSGASADVRPAGEESTVLVKQRRPFHSFNNPFTSGTQMPPSQVVEHSFAALEAWAAERGAERKVDQTAGEFARRLSSKAPYLRGHAETAAHMLDQLMFADWRPQATDLGPLQQLWEALSDVNAQVPKRAIQ
ncbi:MAG: DUF4129 domain-containing protein [Pirellulaceae bacterium]